MTKLRLLGFILAVAGCGARLTASPLTASHPASPEAREAPIAKASGTLALPSSDASMQAATDEGSGSAQGAGAHAGHNMGGGVHAY